MNIGPFIKLRRQELGLTRQALAQYLGKDYSNVYRFEIGQSQWTFEQVKKALGFLGFEIEIKRKD